MTKFIVTLGFGLLTISMIAQERESNVGEVTEVQRFMSQGEQNAFTITIYGADLKSTSGYWDKFVKRFKGKTKTDKKTGEIFSDDCKLPEMSQNTVDVYARFTEQSSDEVNVFSWFDLGGAYLSNEDYPEKGAYASNILIEFARYVAKNQAEVMLTMEEKSLKDLERDLEKLERENMSFHKKIEEAKTQIAKMESNIQMNLEEQAAKKDEIETQKAVLNDAKAEVSKYQ